MDIQSANKIISVLKKINNIDKKLDKKYNTNEYHINVLSDLLNESNDSFLTIIKNLK